MLQGDRGVAERSGSILALKIFDAEGWKGGGGEERGGKGRKGKKVDLAEDREGE